MCGSGVYTHACPHIRREKPAAHNVIPLTNRATYIHQSKTPNKPAKHHTVYTYNIYMGYWNMYALSCYLYYMA